MAVSTHDLVDVTVLGIALAAGWAIGRLITHWVLYGTAWLFWSVVLFVRDILDKRKWKKRTGRG